MTFCRFSGYHGFYLNAEVAVYTNVLKSRMYCGIQEFILRNARVLNQAALTLVSLDISRETEFTCHDHFLLPAFQRALFGVQNALVCHTELSDCHAQTELQDDEDDDDDGRVRSRMPK